MALSTQGEDTSNKRSGPAPRAGGDAEPDLAAGVALLRHPSLTMVLDTPKGRGVFAAAAIPARAVLDVSPMLILDPAENEHFVRHTRLWFYTYNWPLPSGRGQTQALPLGLGSLFNHSRRDQNVGWTRDVARSVVTYITLRDIAMGEELCISYGEGARLGFRDADGDGHGAEPEPEAKTGGGEGVEILGILHDDSGDDSSQLP